MSDKKHIGGESMKKIAAFTAVLMLLSGGLCAHAEDSIFDLMVEGGMKVEVNLADYYMDEMYEAALSGDVEAGRTAEKKRNTVIDMNNYACEKISFDDLYLLAKIIYADAGSDWLTDEFRMCVGEVVMNRVASPEFPNTIYDVIYQKGQYTAVNASSFTAMIPSQECVDIALKLIKGERTMAPSVVYQSNYIQGELFSVYNDWHLGTTYFCVSPNQDLYPTE